MLDNFQIAGTRRSTRNLRQCAASPRRVQHYVSSAHPRFDHRTRGGFGRRPGRYRVRLLQPAELNPSPCRLQADPTVQYAVGNEANWWKKNLTQDHLNQQPVQYLSESGEHEGRLAADADLQPEPEIPPGRAQSLEHRFSLLRREE